MTRSRPNDGLVPARRSPVLTAVDVIVGIALIGFGAVLALVIIAQETVFGGVHSICEARPYTGVQCNGAVLGIAVYGAIAIAIVAWFLGLGFFIVSLLRKRIAFLWPLGAIVVTVAVFYLSTWIVGMTVPA